MHKRVLPLVTRLLPPPRTRTRTRMAGVTGLDPRRVPAAAAAIKSPATSTAAAAMARSATGSIRPSQATATAIAETYTNANASAGGAPHPHEREPPAAPGAAPAPAANTSSRRRMGELYAAAELLGKRRDLCAGAYGNPGAGLGLGLTHAVTRARLMCQVLSCAL
ncbi:hypothetical protein B0H19DRAFT_1375949 [Mycena capillaripes]|nr:hypothetical protein B0H19DRAFT_1375949 [Mycena capillaripes]